MNERNAHDFCAALARSHYENFPVTAPWLRRSERADLAAIYAFCRTTDDLGDEFAGDRLAALGAWSAAVAGALSGPEPGDHAVLRALQTAAKRRRLEPGLFERVIEANRRDQRIDRYPDSASVIEYCTYSATPVGRMVLAVIGADPTAATQADATCIGLQLANFWQDVRRDWEMGRCYLPLDACRRHGVRPAEALEQPRATNELRNLIAEQISTARSWLFLGWPLADALPLRWRPLVRSFSRGGWAICDAIADGGFDPLAARPTLSRRTRLSTLLLELLRAPRTKIPLERTA